MPDFTFDGPNRIIAEPAGSGDTSFDVARDLYSAWKRWVASGAGSIFPPAFAVEGGTPIGATGLFTGTTFILANGWKIKPANHDHQVLLLGNLYSADGLVSVPSDGARTNVFVNSAVAAQGIATGDGVPADVRAKIEELWRMRGLDSANPVTVTPAGETAGDVSIAFSGDGTTTLTQTRGA